MSNIDNNTEEKSSVDHCVCNMCFDQNCKYNLHEKICKVERKLEVVTELLMQIQQSTLKMDDHIKLINNVHETIKTPIDYLKNVVQNL